MDFENSLQFAQHLDQQDELADFRNQFFIPHKKGQPLIYFCGNSLGLQPKITQSFIQQELDDWKNLGVEGHFSGKNPWFYYHHFFVEMANIVGATNEEVVVMNTLTSNLHAMLISFYQPKGKRTKILIEAPTFPSDYYALESQFKLHGLNIENNLIIVEAPKDKYTISTHQFLEAIKIHGDELALVLMGGVNYFTGQFYDIKTITESAHQVGAYAGFDLAHAAGNIPLNLHDWEVDFAVWCTYKYLNSGPGGSGAVFVHEKHGNNKDLLRLAGWWGHDENSRFLMQPGFVPQNGAAGWQLSNAQILSMAALRASLSVFAKTNMPALRKKSILLTNYLYFLLQLKIQNKTSDIKIITPADTKQRGCQLSILTGNKGKSIFEKITQNGVVADWREPNVIRVAPAPLYNTFEEVWQFALQL